MKAPTATAKAVPTAPASSRPWVEKYRPRKLNDVVHQQEIVNALRRCLDQPNPNVPHMLFYGPPGTGKTTTALAVAYELYGPDYCRTKLKELNASDERGIAVVRDKIKKFCHAACTARPYTDAATGTHYKNPGFKLLVLDEADALMHDAQTALRRMMEDYASTTRFVLICNYVSRITDPIISRCSKFRFRPVPHSAAIERLVAVSKAEGVQLGTDEDTQNACFERITHVARGDLRLALNFLQSVGRLGPNASVQAVDDAAGSVPPERVAALFKACCSGAPVAVEVAVEDLTLDGYAGWQVRCFHDWPLSRLSVSCICIRGQPR